MITEEQVQAILDDLETMQVELPSDADGLGPTYLQNKTLELRTHLGRAEVHLQNLMKFRRTLQKELGLAEAEMELRFQDLMTNNTEVTRLPSVKDRENKAKYLLADLHRKILELKVALGDLTSVEVMVKTKLKELKEVSSEIKLHRSLLRDTLDTGSFYGSEGAGNAPVPGPQRPFGHAHASYSARDLLPAGVDLDPARQRDLDKLVIHPSAPDAEEEEFLREMRSPSVNTSS